MKSTLCLLLILAPLFTAGQSALEGHVYDSITKLPLAYVNIGVVSNSTGTTSDSTGFFYLMSDSSDGSLTLKFSMIGYETKTVTVKEFVGRPIHVILQPTGYTLGEIVIKSQDGKDIIGQARKNLPRNYHSSDYHMLGYYTHTHMVGEKIVSFLDGLVDIHDTGFNDKKDNPKITLLKTRETAYKDIKSFKNWLDNLHFGYLSLLLKNNYVKNKNSVLHKSSRYQIDSVYEDKSESIYVISAYDKPYFLTTNPNKSISMARIYVQSDQSKIFKIIEEEGLKADANMKDLAWIRSNGKGVSSAVVYEKKIIEFKEWQEKLYIASIRNETHVADFAEKNGDVLHMNKYVSTFVMNQVYPGKDTDQKKQSAYVNSYWDDYILKRHINEHFFK